MRITNSSRSWSDCTASFFFLDRDFGCAVVGVGERGSEIEPRFGETRMVRRRIRWKIWVSSSAGRFNTSLWYHIVGLLPGMPRIVLAAAICDLFERSQESSWARMQSSPGGCHEWSQKRQAICVRRWAKPRGKIDQSTRNFCCGGGCLSASQSAS